MVAAGQIRRPIGRRMSRSEMLGSMRGSRAKLASP
jgi:hypothetical protein